MSCDVVRGLGVFACAIVVLGLSRPTMATDRHVPGEYPTIQEAVTAAVDGDVVIIAMGTYTGDGNRKIDFLGKAITVRSTDPNDPNIVSKTIINSAPMRAFDFQSGEGAESIVAGLTITGGGTKDSGGSISCIGSSPTILNCTMTNSFAYDAGGAVYCEDSSAAIINCTLIANESFFSLKGGGGVCCVGGAPIISGCYLERNTARLSGGGVYVQDSNASVIDCTFVKNSTESGGAIRCVGSGHVTISGCTMRANQAAWGGGIYCACPTWITRSTFVANYAGQGGGLRVLGNNSVIEDCLFNGNVADSAVDDGCGGAIRCVGGIATINRCYIVGNTAQTNYSEMGGGGIFCHSADPRISDCVIAGNTATSYGGGVLCRSSSPAFTNCTFSQNAATFRGAAFFCGSQSDPTLMNCIVWDNWGPLASEIALFGNFGPSALTVEYSDVKGGPNDVVVREGCTLNWGSGTIDAEPAFIGGRSGTWTSGGNYDFIEHQIRMTDANASWAENELVGKFIEPDVSQGIVLAIVANTRTTVTAWVHRSMIVLQWQIARGQTYQIHDFHLMENSPCIGAGDPNGEYADETDIDGDLRVMPSNGVVDLGADEYRSSEVLPLDIKPGACPNPLNCESQGMLPAAIVGTGLLDLTSLDTGTILLTREGIQGGAAPVRITTEDVARPFDGEPCECHEAGPDGIPDLMLKFRTQDVVQALDLGSLGVGSSVVLTVTGLLKDGRAFAGSDCVRIVGLVKLNVDEGSGGEVLVSPDLPEYTFGSTVTLTARPVAGSRFVGWHVGDPNHPGDANYATLDANNPMTLVMDADYEVWAEMKCGSGTEALLPMALGILGTVFLVRSRRRLWRQARV